MTRILLHCAFAVALVLGGVLGGVMGGPASAQTTTPPANAGAYDALSPGNKMIADAIYDSQLASPNSLAGGLLLANDDIAALMDGETGWGKAYQDLLAQGLVSHANLGLAISSYQRQNNPAATPTIPTGQPATAGIPAGTNTGVPAGTNSGIPPGTNTGVPAGTNTGTGPITSLDGFGDNGDPDGLGADGAAFGAEAAGFGKSNDGIGDGGSAFGAQGRTFGGSASGYGSEGAAYGAGGSYFGGNGSSAGGSSMGSSAASSGAGNSSRGRGKP